MVASSDNSLLNRHVEKQFYCMGLVSVVFLSCFFAQPIAIHDYTGTAEASIVLQGVMSAMRC